MVTLRLGPVPGGGTNGGVVSFEKTVVVDTVVVGDKVVVVVVVVELVVVLPELESSTHTNITSTTVKSSQLFTHRIASDVLFILSLSYIEHHTPSYSKHQMITKL